MSWIEPMYSLMHLAGRILFSAVFIVSGINHFRNMDGMVAYAASKRAPLPKVTVPLTGFLGLVGGVTVLLGWTRFIGAGLLFMFMMFTSFIMHAYWRETDPMARMNERLHFQKDLALGGAALFVAYYGGGFWPFSLGG